MIVEPVNADLAELRGVLGKAGLPIDDLDEPGRTFFRFADEGQTIGLAGLEAYGENVLLRLIVIVPEARSKRLGRRAIGLLLEQVRASPNAAMQWIAALQIGQRKGAGVDRRFMGETAGRAVQAGVIQICQLLRISELRFVDTAPEGRSLMSAAGAEQRRCPASEPAARSSEPCHETQTFRRAGLDGPPSPESLPYGSHLRVGPVVRSIRHFPAA